MQRWVRAVVVALLWLTLLSGVGARREAKRTRQASQSGDPPTATATESSLGMPEVPKPSQASGPEFSDARRTWLNFVRRPGTAMLRKQCLGWDTKPRGLLGPPGPPGAEITPDTLLQEFQEMLKEAMEYRFSGLLDPVWPLGVGPRLVSEAFHCRPKGPRWVDKRTLVELDGFQAPATQGAFLRGSGLNLASGRFTAPASGIFQFSTSLHVDHSELQGKAWLWVRDAMHVLICIESLCQRHMSLEAISGLESNSKVFTAQVQGLLQLQAGQYASVFVDNGSGAVLTIAGSSFSGLLLGT
uniref:Adipolin n=1 Tax=Callithrix jacchus TaxID=9483 RepID=F7EQV6_CALJA